MSGRFLPPTEQSPGNQYGGRRPSNEWSGLAVGGVLARLALTCQVFKLAAGTLFITEIGKSPRIWNKTVIRLWKLVLTGDKQQILLL